MCSEYIYISSFFFRFFSPIGYYRISPVLYSRSLLIIYFIFYLLTVVKLVYLFLLLQVFL